MLAEKFIADPGVNEAWVKDIVTDYKSRDDPTSLPWFKQAAYERGSFATLLGIEYNQEHATVEILAIGDSLAILFDAETKKMAYTWPYKRPERFKARPTLLSTLNEHNAFIGKSRFRKGRFRKFLLKNLERPILLCMTDALGEWALKDELSGGSGLANLVAISSEEELSALVNDERLAKRMRTDDSTLLTVSFDDWEQENATTFL
jgi:hypothetical protein